MKLQKIKNGASNNKKNEASKNKNGASINKKLKLQGYNMKPTRIKNEASKNKKWSPRE